MVRILISCVLLTAAAIPAAPASPNLLDRYCAACHNAKFKSGGLSLDHADPAHPELHPELWEKVMERLRAGLMPPYGAPRPDAAAIRSFITSLEQAIDGPALAHPHVGAPGLRRLSRAEYASSVRDLLGVEIDPAWLPNDSSGHGFDNMAESLTISPALMEGYMRAAGRIAREAVGDPGAQSAVQTFHLPASDAQRDHVVGTPFGTRGGLAIKYTFPADGDYQFKAGFYMTPPGLLWGETMGPGEQLEIAVDGARVALLNIDPALTVNNQTLTTPQVHIAAGQKTVSAAFVNRFSGPLPDTLQQPANDLADRFAGETLGIATLPHLKDFGIEGPAHVTGIGDTPARRRIFVCRPATPSEEIPCAKQILGALARRAFRRPVTDADLETPLKLFRSSREDGDFDAGIRTALQLILAHPEFVFRFERVPAGTPPSTNFRIADLELAARLSYFLWSSIPDDLLLRLASEGKLKDPAVLAAQVRRLLADPRSSALAANFGGQWLGFRDLAGVQRDSSIYPDFDDNLARSMQRETELLLDSVFRENRSIAGLLTADYTFLDERLARHYGLPDVAGTRFRRVTLTDARRFGLLGQGSILMSTSLANRTSPVERGKWILEQMLGIAVPPPPANVAPLKESSGGDRVRTGRELLEEHRRNEPCASCHRMMDPLGFSLENFDAIGSWRIRDGGVPIDSSAVMYDGTKITGPADLRQALVKHTDLFERNFTVKLLTYALGRGLDYRDMPLVRAIEREAARNDYRFDSLVLAIVKSAAFQMNNSGSAPPSSGGGPA